MEALKEEGLDLIINAEDQEIQEIQEEQKKSEDFNGKLMTRYIKKREVYRALNYAEVHKGVPTYIVLRYCDVDFRHFIRSQSGFEDLTEEEIEKILDWLKEYFGMN